MRARKATWKRPAFLALCCRSSSCSRRAAGFACCSVSSPAGLRIALAGFCVLAALLFHFHPGDLMQMISFMKNITIAGGFLVLAGAGPGALALDNRR